MSLSRALFLDRDGVINIDHAYVCTQDEFQFIDGIFEVCRCAQELGYLIFVITNQAGIGRGYYTEQTFLNLTDWMCGAFKSEGVSIDKVYFCPFHPEHGVGRYKIDSPFRKPGPGMILQAAAEFGVDLKHSILLGDKESDIGAGLAAGVGCNLLYRPVVNAFESSDSVATAVVAKLAEVRPFLDSQMTQ
ncbi:MAG: HAD family hydrolase [Gallionella sp.]|nr:HAD family hydrolase [Gallionella sp.]